MGLHWGLHLRGDATGTLRPHLCRTDIRGGQVTMTLRIPWTNGPVTLHTGHVLAVKRLEGVALPLLA